MAPPRKQTGEGLTTPVMDSDAETISLDSAGNDFVFRRTYANGRREEMILSRQNVLMLAQSAQRLKIRLLVKQSRPGVDAVVLTPVARIGLNTDVHKTMIHLTMIDQQGEEMGFLLPMEVARPLAEGLPVRLAEIDCTTKTLTRH